MTTQIIGKQVTWSGSIDSAGYRTYKISFKIKADFTDGPANVMQTPGLFLPGSPWIVDDDIDLWVWCRPDMDCKIFNQKEGEVADIYIVEQTFSNKPLDVRIQRCQDIRIEDPLLEPMKVSGGFVKKTIEATEDRNGNPLQTSSHEQLRGGVVEFNDDHDTISIEQNVINLDLALVESLKNKVNKFPMWGLPARTILLTEFKWEKKFYGLCYQYYTRKFTFEINEETFDKEAVDEGTKVLNGHWSSRPTEGPKKRWILDNIDVSVSPDPSNPMHFIRFIDFNGNTAKVILDGFGQPYNPLLEDETQGCSECESGMGRYLKITNADTDFEGNFKEQTIAYSKECLWGNASLSLEFDSGSNRWILTDLDNEVVWYAEADDWDCVGESILQRDITQGIDVEAPDTVMVSQTESSPGKITIEYYDEDDFSRLGIPLIL